MDLNDLQRMGELPSTAFPEASDLKILKSRAGYYIGRIITDEHGNEWPYSRESGYFKTSANAEEALAIFKE